MIKEEFRYIRELLNRVCENDPDFRISGSDNHRYRLGAPLKAEYLLLFEREHGVTLPSDYRSFLTDVGDGGALRAGAGPNFGLQTLARSTGDCDPATPFPLVADPRDDQPLGKQFVPGNEEWGDEELWPGVLEISYAGCANYSFLVVNGEAYGTVWEANGDSNQYFPTGRTFWEWYQRWLEGLEKFALPVLAHERLVEKVHVGMTKKQVIAVCGGQWEDRVTVYRFLRFGHLATVFELDENDTVSRIVRHSISPWVPYGEHRLAST